MTDNNKDNQSNEVSKAQPIETEAETTVNPQITDAVTEVNTPEAPEPKSQYDFVLFGATSFVGKILCEYMSNQYSSQEVNWAIAGRSQAKLDALKSELGDKASTIPLIVADAADEASLQAMCNSTKVVVSTVGPYALYGEPLVKVCAETGTDYCDLTGETQWIAAMLKKYEAKAKETGARIVNCCGFDSIPSDLGLLFLQEQAHEQYGEYCYRVKMRVKAANGGFSGGTVASLINVVKEATENPGLRRELANPYALCPDGHHFFVHQASNGSAKFDSDFKRWIAPFIMAAINTRIVHRSHALLDGKYGKNFQYDEAMLMKSKWVAKATSFALNAFMLGAAIKPARAILEKFFLPKPGEGPSKEEQENGFFNLQFFGETAGGKTLRTKVTGDRDPGYGSTAKMLAETAIFFANMEGNNNTAEKQGGFWTPSSLFGMPLVERLQEKAGLTFEKVD
ncbi:saccharopine dehydrogenase NADP-binding domain-containing protein [Paraneptunicella aestuarii]|uniref:saccharopine dehydrogenase family protein n=1 Tax=Paraneptunicella aestuarii TaxID=2831148 RepID=UPI001E4A56BA|nr:saccharopine dehydrogenase NADP-binding domain-containing protein [Paraneptunicella aestuarii]UAA39808.1 saccharopine dehydrogenase NADP-binding domain-containing protein [Paraneptunicella aestuarii]